MKQLHRRVVVTGLGILSPIGNTLSEAWDSCINGVSGISKIEIDLKNTVNSIEKFSSIELLAIGIGHDVTRYYKRAVKITDVHDLGDAMINQLTDLFSNKKNIH